jgi:hypothetical protein
VIHGEFAENPDTIVPMNVPGRGVLYVVWGNKCQEPLRRSIESLRRHHPTLPFHVAQVTPQDSAMALLEKSKMGSLTPFESTLYLDADTIVMGKLDYGFDRAERFGIAGCICECPWSRRYGAAEGDGIEYNTGVIFFSKLAQSVFSTWETISRTTPSASSWMTLDNRPRGILYDDQASFSRSLRICQWNPFVLPINYNLRPLFHHSVFAPIKIWHDYQTPPLELEALNGACERGERPVTYAHLRIPREL